MAQLQMFVGDKVYNAILESMPGTTDDERLVELKKYIRGVIRDRVRFLRHGYTFLIQQAFRRLLFRA